jgi:hypothetical protein
MLTIAKTNLATGDIVDNEIQFRDTLLEALHPDINLSIGNISSYLQKIAKAESIAKTSKSASKRTTAIKSITPLKKQAIAALTKGLDKYQLAGASGARKHGDFFFSQGLNPFATYFPSAMGQINYGSILMTECLKIYSIERVNILIVQDKEHRTDDCHGKISHEFLNQLRQSQDFVIPANTPFQFRAGIANQWVAKGTLQLSLNCPKGIDLILPLSCFKGYKPELGIHKLANLKLGIVNFAQKRRVKTSYTVWQWFSPQAIAQDVLPTTQQKAETLVAAQRDIKQLCQLVQTEQWVKTDDPESEPNEEEADGKILAEILKHDIHGQLLEHPYVVRKIEDLVRRRWLTLATSGGINFTSFMAQPCPELGELEMSIPEMPEGEYVGFRYPIRDRNDLQIWTNKHIKGLNQQGTMYVNPDIARDYCGMDFDGDTFCVKSVQKLPEIAKEIRQHHIKPTTYKPDKVPVQGTLAEVALRSTENQIGLITYYLATAWATGNHQYIGGLAQEVQVAVDRLKSDLSHDQAFLDEVGKSLPKLDWLIDRKQQGVYGSYYDPKQRCKMQARPMQASGEYQDAISFLIQAVNDIWQPVDLHERTLLEFRELFSKPSETLYKRAIARRDEYTSKIREAMKLSSEKESRKKILRAAVQWAKGLGDKLRQKSEKTAQTCAAAMWQASHNGDHGTASVVFNMFLPEICDRLHDNQLMRLQIVGAQYGELASTKWTGNGEHACIPILVSQRQEDGRYQIEVIRKSRKKPYLLGLVAKDSAKVLVGEYTASLKTQQKTIVCELVAA